MTTSADTDMVVEVSARCLLAAARILETMELTPWRSQAGSVLRAYYRLPSYRSVVEREAVADDDRDSAISVRTCTVAEALASPGRLGGWTTRPEALPVFRVERLPKMRPTENRELARAATEIEALSDAASR